MASESRIEWTEQTWNPVTGCTKVSPGCKHCYAEVMSHRLNAMGTPGYENGFEVTLHPGRLVQPTMRRAPTIYFVNSMSDLFHPDVPDAFLDKVIEVITHTPRHTYQVLTKRANRLPDYFSDKEVPKNMWLGVSVEDRQYGVPRIGHLQKVKSATRFLSVEPLLEDVGQLNLQGIDWVIVGGESGHNARPMHEAWALSIRNQCVEADVPFFFKQWGTWGPDLIRRNKKANGRILEGILYDNYPLVMTV